MNINHQEFSDILLRAAHENFDKGQHEVAIGLFEQGLQKLEATVGQDSLRLTPILADLSECYEVVGNRLKASECRSRLSAILKVSRLEHQNGIDCPSEHFFH